MRCDVSFRDNIYGQDCYRQEANRASVKKGRFQRNIGMAGTGTFEARLAALRAYLRYVLEQKGWTAFALGRAAGVAGRTITRYLNQDPAHLMSVQTLNKIANASGIPPGADVVSALQEVPAPTVPEIMLEALRETRRQLEGLDADEPLQARTIADIYDDLFGAVREGIELDAARRHLRRRFDAAREKQKRSSRLRARDKDKR